MCSKGTKSASMAMTDRNSGKDIKVLLQRARKMVNSSPEPRHVIHHHDNMLAIAEKERLGINFNRSVTLSLASRWDVVNKLTVEFLQNIISLNDQLQEESQKQMRNLISLILNRSQRLNLTSRIEQTGGLLMHITFYRSVLKAKIEELTQGSSFLAVCANIMNFTNPGQIMDRYAALKLILGETEAAVEQQKKRLLQLTDELTSVRKQTFQDTMMLHNKMADLHNRKNELVTEILELERVLEQQEMKYAKSLVTQRRIIDSVHHCYALMVNYKKAERHLTDPLEQIDDFGYRFDLTLDALKMLEDHLFLAKARKTISGSGGVNLLDIDTVTESEPLDTNSSWKANRAQDNRIDACSVRNESSNHLLGCSTAVYNQSSGSGKRFRKICVGQESVSARSRREMDESLDNRVVESSQCRKITSNRDLANEEVLRKKQRKGLFDTSFNQKNYPKSMDLRDECDRANDNTFSGKGDGSVVEGKSLSQRDMKKFERRSFASSLVQSRFFRRSKSLNQRGRGRKRESQDVTSRSASVPRTMASLPAIYSPRLKSIMEEQVEVSNQTRNCSKCSRNISEIGNQESIPVWSDCFTRCHVSLSRDVPSGVSLEGSDTSVRLSGTRKSKAMKKRLSIVACRKDEMLLRQAGQRFSERVKKLLKDKQRYYYLDSANSSHDLPSDDIWDSGVCLALEAMASVEGSKLSFGNSVKRDRNRDKTSDPERSCRKIVDTSIEGELSVQNTIMEEKNLEALLEDDEKFLRKVSSLPITKLPSLNNAQQGQVHNKHTSQSKPEKRTQKHAQTSKPEYVRPKLPYLLKSKHMEYNKFAGMKSSILGYKRENPEVLVVKKNPLKKTRYLAGASMAQLNTWMDSSTSRHLEVPRNTREQLASLKPQSDRLKTIRSVCERRQFKQNCLSLLASIDLSSTQVRHDNSFEKK